MTGTQYKNVAQWTLANGAAEASESAAAAKAIFDNMGVPFPAGSCGETLLTLMSEDYMGWRACTHLEAQEYANAGTAAVGIDGEHVVVILPEEGEGLVGAVVQANATSYARQASDISTAERITMQFYANSAAATNSWNYYANRLVEKARGYNGYTGSQLGLSGAWCVRFVCRCANEVGLLKSDIMPNTASSGTMKNFYGTNSGQSGTLHTAITELIGGVRPGDILFTCDHVVKVDGKYTRATAPAHTCIAISTSMIVDNKHVINTINGAWSNKVQEVKFGYVTPEVKMENGAPAPLKDDQGNVIPNCYKTVDQYIGWYAHPHYERANS